MKLSKMVFVASLLTLTTSTLAQTTADLNNIPPPIQMGEIKKNSEFPQFLQGEVTLLGEQFPGAEEAITKQLKAKRIKLQVITSKGAAPRFQALKKLGADVRYLNTPSMEGAAIYVGKDLIIMLTQDEPRKWVYIKDLATVTRSKEALKAAWTYSQPL
ncbi:hypothetical protein [Deinococcus cellulosilyticus]|uniref:Uncharacterized protein n=1 Tax=Deinococcus cellulosilyticus (strain DSM 18568 / NBRC 106333 / KACC 11606 / 5516J-15) TaxID=1223518 RepID=A0A511NAQ2_DEIC1|nr:hypothetical protein [Deinococcus cellulosilyticus]GEM49909.1 hypothetical protein DC3_55440 [Deinococcus cellulosilyticus NBRC 106333 = KACC 11606]